MIIKYLSGIGIWRWIGRQQVTTAQSFNNSYLIPNLVSRLFAIELATITPEKKYSTPLHLQEKNSILTPGAPKKATPGYLTQQILSACAAKTEMYHDLMKLLELGNESRKQVFDLGEHLAAAGLVDIRFRASRMYIRITEQGINYLR
ncbi:hypothetical protein [Pontibacter vulgaris]|uniref:hypothetical protein n=1 Tax=Pontibacter vulgaris TaxID=2905679 RepID=UPI001FA6F931|nr:hypothetical protein [Pontibacter vulgaris]